MTMLPSDVARLFMDHIPSGDMAHQLSYFSAHAKRGNVFPFHMGLYNALRAIDEAAPGYAEEMIKRLAALPGTGIQPYERVLQVLGEIYVTVGAVRVADVDDASGRRILAHEPAIAGGKNPEFESRSSGIWYAIEVKTPELIEHRGRVTKNPWQLNARLPRDATAEAFPAKETTLPRDNPVKDFLVSAEAKFAEYAKLRPEAFRVLTIVWDDFCNEPIAALLAEPSGLFTPNSFFKDAAGNPVVFPHVDGVVVCRYYHQLMRLTRVEPLIDGAMPFAYHNEGFPFKAFIANPHGREVPEQLLDVLNAYPPHPTLGAEYMPSEVVMWFGGMAEKSSPDADS